MIAGCTGTMRGDPCRALDRRDCSGGRFPILLGGRRRGGAAPLTPFLSFLGEMAKALDSRSARRRALPTASPVGAEVERRLEPLLASGEVGIERLARDLGHSRQTLYRRLKAEGTTYERLLDGLRRRLALHYLSEGLTVKDSAYRLGFSDPAAFSRAFKRWTGTSPSTIRARH